MSIIERPAPPAVAVSATDRLRVITGGSVGNMEARLGTSGFDVIAVAQTEEDLMIAVAADEPDAIVVEADLCASLERVRDLAPDAVLIVVGDHTPAGALGRIEHGVSGTVMAGLLHALVAEGVAGAAVWGLVPALSVPSPMPAHHATMSLLVAKAEPLRRFVSSALHEHADLVAAAGTVVVTASASLLLTLGNPHHVDRPVQPHIATPLVRVMPSGRILGTAWMSPPHGRPATRPETTASVARDGSGSRPHGTPQSPPSAHHPSPPTNDASRPPGVANGWNHHATKNDDKGKRSGWTNNHVPDDPSTRQPAEHPTLGKSASSGADAATASCEAGTGLPTAASEHVPPDAGGRSNSPCSPAT